MMNRDDYVAKMKLQLDEMNARLGEFEVKAQAAQVDMRAACDKEMLQLRAQSKAAGTMLDELKVAGENAWQQMATESEKLGKAFNQACTQAFSHFKSKP
ncbi:MAG: hypothetical protein RJA98_1595 [Pseudomonadota bacterium]|jgi:hypothetical protein